MARDRRELKLLLKVVAFLYTKTNLDWYFTGPDPYLAIIAKACRPCMLSVAKKKAWTMGRKSGIPDICICNSPPALGLKGTYIELKVGKNTLTAEQKEWAEKLREAGYYVGVVKDTLENFKAELTELGYVFK